MAVYSIKNNFIEITVNSLGAELSSLKNTIGTELLWQANKDIWPRHAPVLFPIVGRLKNNSFTYKGQNYSLSQHGFARDKDFLLIEQSDNTLKFELTADESTLEIYPFHFSLIISYTLKEATLDISYEIFNPDNKELLFSIGAHPGFSTCRVPGESLNDYYLEMEGVSTLIAERLQNGLLSGNTYEISLHKNVLPLTTELFDNDALVFRNNQIKSVKLKSKNSGHGIELICNDWPYFGIWTKKGCNQFVCLEPWFGITDSIISNGEINTKEGIIQLDSLARKTVNYRISLI